MVLNRKEAADQEKLKEVKSYKEAFDHYDWIKNGTIPIKVNDLAHIILIVKFPLKPLGVLCLCTLNTVTCSPINMSGNSSTHEY